MTDEPGVFRTRGPAVTMTAVVSVPVMALADGMVMAFDLGEIAVGVVAGDWIAAPAADHARLVCALFAGAERLAQLGIHPEIGGRNASCGRLAAARASNRFVEIRQARPVSEYAMAAAFVVVDRHSLSQSL